MSNFADSSPAPASVPRLEPFVVQYRNQLGMAGLVFVGLAFICIAAVVLKTLTGDSVSVKGAGLMDIFYYSAPNIILIVTGFISALIGRSLLNAGQRSSYSSLPEGDLAILREAIIDGKSDPIDQYIRLRALSGFTGGFTKIQLTGLPLVTIGVTMIFTVAALAFFQNDRIFTSLFDLAKLTLGAFIGSYVQRQVERRQQESDAGRSPPSPPLPT
jgi:hypothetical protein